MRTHHNGTCCVTVFLHVNSLRVIESTCITTRFHQIMRKCLFRLKRLPVINLWGLLIEDIEYFYAYI